MSAKMRVKIGIELEPLIPVPAVRMNMRLARALGADDFWLPDHVRHILPKSLWQSSPMSRIVPDLDAWLDPTVVIARYCRHGGPRMGTLVTDAVRRESYDVARGWMSLHHLTRGNAVLGIGAGELMNIAPIGMSASQAVSRLEDLLCAVRAAWEADGAYITHTGPFHDWRDASFPPQYRNSTPPIWVAANSPRTSRLAGRWGDGWIYLAERIENWKTSAVAVAGAARVAGRDPHAMEWSLATVALLASSRKQFVKMCESPLIKAGALIMPGAAWSALGAKHPFGADFPGLHQHNPAQDAQLLAGDSFREACREVTPDLLEELWPAGPAARVADRLTSFVEHGVSHITIANFAPSAGYGNAADGFKEHWKLNRMLKAMRPGSRSWTAGEKSVTPSSDGAVAREGDVVGMT